MTEMTAVQDSLAPTVVPCRLLVDTQRLLHDVTAGGLLVAGGGGCPAQDLIQDMHEETTQYPTVIDPVTLVVMAWTHCHNEEIAVYTYHTHTHTHARTHARTTVCVC